MVKIGSVVWPGFVGVGAGLVKGTASFLDYAERASAIEIGSITKNTCEGNAGQTVWKRAEDSSLRHNAGMPNPGVDNIVQELSKVQSQISIPWGLNLAVTPGLKDNGKAAGDIAATSKIAIDGGLDPKWITLNVSSPDTQDKVEMLSQPERVWGLIRAMRQSVGSDIPIWLKVAVGLKRSVYERLADISIQERVGAVIVSNAWHDDKVVGGWCGKAIKAKVVPLVGVIKQFMRGKVPIVASGGVFYGEDAADMRDAGASAVMIVSAMLFRGRMAAVEIEKEYEEHYEQNA